MVGHHTGIRESSPIAPDGSGGCALTLVGAILLFAPLIGVSITVISLIRDFSALPRSMPTGDPSSVSIAVGGALIATVIGYGVSLTGAVLVCIAVSMFHYTPEWVWRTLVAASILWLVTFPFGTLFGAIAFVVLLRRRGSFRLTSG